MRKTKIVATVGPACRDEKILQSLLKEGADILRVNASHTKPSELAAWIRRIRRAAGRVHKPVAILVDLQGPRVRTGKLRDGKPLNLKPGQKVSIVPSSGRGFGSEITTPCRQFLRMVKAGDQILIDNGSLKLKVLAAAKGRAQCEVVTGGILGENKGINLPNAPVTLPTLGLKDRRDLKIALDEKVDYVALSFVRSEKDLFAIKHWFKPHGRKIPVIAKIEKPGAVRDIHAIVSASDSIMVARGDLGIEMGVAKVPVIQKKLIAEANRMRIPVITATQMLESMMTQPFPTRAEASDIANAIFDGTDAVMLSGETAIGKYPVESVKVMSGIIREAEHHLGETPATGFLEEDSHPEDLPVRAITHAARHAAKDLHAKAIIVFTRSGKTAALMSKFRPLSAIIAMTDSDEISRRLVLYRGIYPLRISYGGTMDAMLRKSDKAVLDARLLKKNDCAVVLSGRLAFPAAQYTTKIHTVGHA